MAGEVSNRRRSEVIGALRRGTVPESGLDLLAVGLERFTASLDAELDTVADGGAVFKAVRGEYGAGKTFFTRHLAERALRRGFAAAEVQISETETPLHRLETVYRRITQSLRTASIPPSAFRAILDSWLFTVESDVLAAVPSLETASGRALAEAVDRLLEQRLAGVSSRTPVFAAALRGYRAAVETGDGATADGLAAWMGGQPQVAASVKRSAGIRGELDHFGALGFLQALLTVLRDAGHPGLVLVLDEVETLQRVRGDVRDKAFNALRQLIDEIDAGRFPGLYLLMTGTPAFYDGPSGASRLPPLAQRLATDFGPTRASTTRGRCRSDSPASTTTRSFPSASRSETCTPTAARSPSGCGPMSTTGTSANWPRRSPVGSVAGSASRHGSSSRSSSPTSSTGSTRG